MELNNKQLKTYMMICDIVDFQYEDKTSLKNRLFEYFEYKNKQSEEKFIKWLENEIKETNNTIERLEGTNSCRIPNLKIRLSNYQEVLDKFRGVIDD